MGRTGRALLLAAAVGLLASSAIAQSLDQGSVMEAVEKLRPGQYLWAPQVAPEGPMLVVVNIQTQRLTAYRNGVVIAVSTVSTGKPGHRTPEGVFTILQKNMWHRSNLYSNAPMPYMQRLTWGGVALHGGQLPGYPASHGCVRLPHEFAKLLFGQTALGMVVVVTNAPGVPRFAPAPNALQPEPMAWRPGSGGQVWQPQLSPSGPVSILVSAADRRAVVIRNGVQIGSAPVKFDGPITRATAYTLQSVDASGRHWMQLPLPGQVTPGEDASRFHLPEPFRELATTAVGIGTTMVITPDSLALGGLEPEPAIIQDDWAWVPDARLKLPRS